MLTTRSLPVGIAILLLGACGEPLDSKIVGVWHGTIPPQSLDFGSSGAVTLHDQKSNRRYQGRYSISGQNLEMQFDAFARPVVRGVKISGDALTLYRNAGPPEVLYR